MGFILSSSYRSDMIKTKHFQYIDDLVKWCNENIETEDIVAIVEAGRFSEGFHLVYK